MFFLEVFAFLALLLLAAGLISACLFLALSGRFSSKGVGWLSQTRGNVGANLPEAQQATQPNTLEEAKQAFANTVVAVLRDQAQVTDLHDAAARVDQARPRRRVVREKKAPTASEKSAHDEWWDRCEAAYDDPDWALLDAAQDQRDMDELEKEQADNGVYGA